MHLSSLPGLPVPEVITDRFTSNHLHLQDHLGETAKLLKRRFKPGLLLCAIIRKGGDVPIFYVLPWCLAFAFAPEEATLITARI